MSVKQNWISGTVCTCQGQVDSPPMFVEELPEQMPEIILAMTDELLTITVEAESFSITRVIPPESELEDIEDEMPEDVDEGGP